MKVIVLGSGTSTGVPEIGCPCSVCTSTDPHDNRLRASILLTNGGDNILIDCGPDFRQQVLHLPFRAINGVLITHEHYDHVGGLDDLRPFCRFGAVPVYAQSDTAERLRMRMPYCFSEHKYPGIPNILMNDIAANRPFHIGETEILPLRVMHGKLPILGYRIGAFAYITDMSFLPEESLDLLKGVEVLMMNALRITPHPAHQTLGEAVKLAIRIGAQRTYLTHISHQMGRHADVDKMLPDGIHLAYDGLTFTTL
jgi:phosphoribosyl 1,2-cyclic phosphate phosphodiesterase